ncbi:hypothetical protein ACOMHN_025551 [Nucella lapillus]
MMSGLLSTLVLSLVFLLADGQSGNVGTSGNVGKSRNVGKSGNAMRCPSGWYKFKYSCYTFSYDQLTYKRTQEFCKERGAKMVEIESAEENDFVQKTLTELAIQNIWMGLTDLVEEGKFVWESTQREPGYTNWAPGEPNDSNSGRDGEDCTQFRPNGEWNDDGCTVHVQGDEIVFYPGCELESVGI